MILLGFMKKKIRITIINTCGQNIRRQICSYVNYWSGNLEFSLFTQRKTREIDKIFYY